MMTSPYVFQLTPANSRTPGRIAHFIRWQDLSQFDLYPGDRVTKLDLLETFSYPRGPTFCTFCIF